MRDPAPRPGRSLLKRAALAAALIVVSAAVGAGAVVMMQLEQVAGIIDRVPKLRLGDSVQDADLGEPQTLLLLGSDARWHRGRRLDGRSDTIILVRLDPQAAGIPVLSIPRDLKVQIPQPDGTTRTAKINAAYEQGGPKLTVQTVSALLGIDINHVIEVSFGGFRAGVDAIGCVFADVDRRYFNTPENAARERYAPIDLKPGYQKLCGQDALDFVRFRHTDTDLVRNARQQAFLRQAKQQISVRGLLEDRDALARLLARYARTDISGRVDVLKLLRLGAGVADKPVRHIPFPAQLGPSFVTADPQQIAATAQRFLQARPEPQPAAGRPRRGAGTTAPASGSVFDVPGVVRAQTARAQAGQVTVQLPVYYPSRVVDGSTFAQPPRSYTIIDPNGVEQQAYRMVLDLGGTAGYYGVQGTSWYDPPMLAHPSRTRTVNGRKLLLFYAGDRLATVAWRPREGGAYWVQNTLTFRLTNRQMIAVAASLRRG